jgi:tetratricopeptide (TPR) repeat protein
MFPLAYLGYLGVAALVSLLTSCNSTEKKAKEDLQISPEPPPRPEPPKLTVSEGEPAYGVYLQLEEAGVKPEQMDRVGKDGKVTEEDLLYIGRSFYRSDLSPEDNKLWAEKIQNSFKDASDRYFSRGAEQNGLTFPAVCQNLDLFKKATFWNYDNERAQFILGVCQSDPKRLRHAIQVNPAYTEAKEALEKISRAATQKNPDDAEAWKLLGDALKMQGKAKEAKASYHKALELNPELEIAQDK